jgi:hypothetical protein
MEFLGSNSVNLHRKEKSQEYEKQAGNNYE